MEKITYLQLYVQHCRVETLVNDIVIQRKYEKNITTITQPIHEFLIAGENTLSLNILPYVGPEFESTAQVHLRIARFNEGDFLEFTGGELLAEIIFSEQHLIEGASRRTFTQTVPFYQTSSGKTWAWQQARPLVLNDETINALNKFMGAIHRDFKAKVADNILPLAQVQIEELAYCYPSVSIDDRLQEMREFISAPSDNNKPMDFMPLNVHNLGYRLAAGGRLVECKGRDGLPLIRTQTQLMDSPHEDNNYIALPMHVGYIHNDFEILR